MNYIAEVNAFHRSLTQNDLSIRAVAIWFFLMNRANLSNWEMPLKVSEMEIRGVMSMGHEAFLNARAELVEGGYILHKPQAGRKKPHYYINSLTGKH